MKKWNLIKSVMLALGFLISANTANADALDLSEGTMTTSGSANITLNRAALSGMTAAAWGWAARLGYGYFVIDNLSIDFQVATNGRFTNPVSGLGFGLGIGATYFFDTGSMVNPYLGLMPGIGWGGNIWSINLTPSAGVLVGLNSHVALDFGLMATFSWGLGATAPAGTWIEGQVGYAGVRAFF